MKNISHEYLWILIETVEINEKSWKNQGVDLQTSDISIVKCPRVPNLV